MLALTSADKQRRREHQRLTAPAPTARRAAPQRRSRHRIAIPAILRTRRRNGGNGGIGSNGVVVAATWPACMLRHHRQRDRYMLPIGSLWADFHGVLVRQAVAE
jgi:hypothetical protein